ncbi:hypothetical protein [Planosporangium thailandense]|uniref:hypothetical protein n=1 Tax=Planosporangium thailandense TaxID=765197 RepID=UPI00197BFAD9|nr:hypothetical protein [Planosporangium thailandense]
MNARTWLRVGLVFLAVAQGAAGAVQLLLPRVFYDDFPAAGHPWVSLLPPYNEHLMRDVGAGTLAYVLVVGVAAVSMDRRMVRTALAANLVFSVPHLVFHATHLQHFPPVDAITQTILLSLGVIIPVVLLLSERVLSQREPVPEQPTPHGDGPVPNAIR